MSTDSLLFFCSKFNIFCRLKLTAWGVLTDTYKVNLPFSGIIAHWGSQVYLNFAFFASAGQNVKMRLVLSNVGKDIFPLLEDTQN